MTDITFPAISQTCDRAPAAWAASQDGSLSVAEKMVSCADHAPQRRIGGGAHAGFDIWVQGLCGRLPADTISCLSREHPGMRCEVADAVAVSWKRRHLSRFSIGVEAEVVELSAPAGARC